MAVIAVAGGSGGVGKTIVERLLQESKFQVVVLSRQVSIPPSKTRLNIDSTKGILNFITKREHRADRLQRYPLHDKDPGGSQHPHHHLHDWPNLRRNKPIPTQPHRRSGSLDINTKISA